jgi:hypothetical protein
MNLEDLLVKELDNAIALYRFYSDLKYKITGVFSTTLVLLLTLAIRGDLPQQIYLLIAVVLFLAALYHSRLAHRESCAKAAVLISEKKLNEWAKSNLNGTDVFDLSLRVLYLRSGGVFHKRVSGAGRILAAAVLFFLYLLFAYKGMAGLGLNSLWRLTITFLFAVAACAFLYLARQQILERRARVEKVQTMLSRARLIDPARQQEHGVMSASGTHLT